MARNFRTPGWRRRSCLETHDLSSMHWFGWSARSVQTGFSDFTPSSAAVDPDCDCNSFVSGMGVPEGSGPETWEASTEAPRDRQHSTTLEAAEPLLSDNTPGTTLSQTVATAASFRQHGTVFEDAAAIGSAPLQGTPQQLTARFQSATALEAPSNDYIYNLLVPLSAFEGQSDADSSVAPYERQHPLSRATGGEPGAVQGNPSQLDAIYRPQIPDSAQSGVNLLSSVPLPVNTSIPEGQHPLAMTEYLEDPAALMSRRPRSQPGSSAEPKPTFGEDEIEDGSQILASISTMPPQNEDERRTDNPSTSRRRPRCVEPEHRIGKKRVYNPCHECKRDKHIRSNQCPWCNAPKGPPAKRRPRPKSSE